MPCWPACNQANLDGGRWPRAGCLLELCLPGLPDTQQLYHEQLPPTQALAARSNPGSHAATAGSRTKDDERAPTDRGAPVWHAQHWMGATHFLTRALPQVSTEMSLHVLAYNLKRLMSIFGVTGAMAALRA